MSETTRHVFEVDDGEQWWIVAETEEAALEHAKVYDIGADYLPPHGGPGEWERMVSVKVLPDDRDLSITMVDDSPEQVAADAAEGGFPPSATVEGQIVRATAGQWAAHMKDGAMVGCTVY